ncbi:MAG: hypothetical protein AB1540_05550 [Bdellovibrionota bacterium]
MSGLNFSHANLAVQKGSSVFKSQSQDKEIDRFLKALRDVYPRSAARPVGSSYQFCWQDFKASLPQIICRDRAKVKSLLPVQSADEFGEPQPGDRVYYYPAVAQVKPAQEASVYCSYIGVDESGEEALHRLKVEELLYHAVECEGKTQKHVNKPKCLSHDLIEKKTLGVLHTDFLAAFNFAKPYTGKELPLVDINIQCHVDELKHLLNREKSAPVIYEKSLAPEKKREIVFEQKKALGIPYEPTRPRPRDLAGAILERTQPRSTDKPRCLEVCYALDRSGSMEEDISSLKHHTQRFDESWSSQFKDGCYRVSVVEFGQGYAPAGEDPMAADLDTPLERKKNPEFKAYIEKFQTQGAFEPVFDAIVECTKKFQLTGAQREIIVITDEPGDRLAYSPTPEQAKAKADAVRARLSWIDLNEFDRSNNPYAHCNTDADPKRCFEEVFKLGDALDYWKLAVALGESLPKGQFKGQEELVYRMLDSPKALHEDPTSGQTPIGILLREVLDENDAIHGDDGFTYFDNFRPSGMYSKEGLRKLYLKLVSKPVFPDNEGLQNLIQAIARDPEDRIDLFAKLIEHNSGTCSDAVDILPLPDLINALNNVSIFRACKTHIFLAARSEDGIEALSKFNKHNEEIVKWFKDYFKQDPKVFKSSKTAQAVGRMLGEGKMWKKEDGPTEFFLELLNTNEHPQSTYRINPTYLLGGLNDSISKDSTIDLQRILLEISAKTNPTDVKGYILSVLKARVDFVSKEAISQILVNLRKGIKKSGHEEVGLIEALMRDAEVLLGKDHAVTQKIRNWGRWDELVE